MRRKQVASGQATSSVRKALGMQSIDTREMVFPGRLDLGATSSHLAYQRFGYTLS
ncbi:hypothetical protein D3C80_1829620 [compost metagenome]